MKKLSTSGAFIQWSMLLWMLPSECLPLSLWLRLGVFVTFTCINMCTSRVFVIQLLLPDDIRFVIEDEEVEFKRGFYPMVHAFMAAAIWVFTFRMKLMTCNDLRGPTCLWLCSLRLHHRGRYLFRSCPGTFIKTSFHVFNVIEWSLWPSLHFCDILSLWLSVWGSVWPLFASVCAHRWYSWSSCHYQMIYDS